MKRFYTSKSFLILFFSLFISAACFAQSIVTGKVSGDNNQPLSGQWFGNILSCHGTDI